MNDVVTVALIAAVPMTASAVVTAYVGLRILDKATNIEVKVDGHLDKLVRAVTAADIAKGVLQEKERQEDDPHN